MVVDPHAHFYAMMLELIFCTVIAAFLISLFFQSDSEIMSYIVAAMITHSSWDLAMSFTVSENIIPQAY